VSTTVLSPTDAATERHLPSVGELVVPERLGPERPDVPGRYLALEGVDGFIALDRDVVHIGRGLTADVRLDDHLVSRRHAVLVRRSTGHRLLDDRSANGTMVNGRRVEQAELGDGDIIVIGRAILRYLVVD
jgi:pSer/pThr/pTyr-binding forkhead associated (FHA) protein